MAAGMTIDKLIAEMDKALQFPGVANSWTMPIKARIDMLSTGIRTPIGIKVFGKDLDEMEKAGARDRGRGQAVPGTTSAFAERITGGFYLNIEPDREQLARYGLAVGDLQDVVGTALGGEMVTTTVEGRERYGVTVRYPRELRSDPQQIAREVLVPTMDGAMIPLGQVAKVVEVAKGAPASAPRTRCCRPTSMSTSATATSAATWPMRARRWPNRSSSRPATTRPGAASSSTWSAPSRR
jgi:Cu(I)/Ag(I) efflux system membrane protein CusA/SilA